MTSKLGDTGMFVYGDSVFTPTHLIPEGAIEIDCEEIGLSRSITYGFEFKVETWTYILKGEKKKIKLHDPTEGYFLHINSYGIFYKYNNIIYYKGGFSIT